MAERKPKPEPNPKQENKRLNSLGRPRDLLLAGAGTSKSKKVFTPNLNAVRNKGKAVPNLSSDGNRKNAKRQSKDFKKRDSEASRFVQSTGIFSEGTGGDAVRSGGHASRSGEAREGGGEPAAGMEKPKIDTDAVWNIDMGEEARVIADLLDAEHAMLEDNVHDEYQPVVLPLSKNSNNFFATFAPQEMKVKQEVHDTAELSEMLENLNRCSFTTPKLFNESNVAYSIVKLPDSMPGRGFDEEGKVIDYTLDQMNDGPIGKIVRRRSGKMEMIIGDMTYELNSVEAEPFTEELMVMPEPDTPEHSATMTNLGTINERFVISPSWKNLLRKPDT